MRLGAEEFIRAAERAAPSVVSAVGLPKAEALAKEGKGA